ncbi:MAG TPA: hypothetical protein VLU25_14080 [Acidobacteriota bacterium]|nr:hypothetical protein [Acidobacteriota bacterium]
MAARIEHQDRLVREMPLTYAGRKNVFEGRFKVPEVEKDYEVLSITVTAAQASVGNFGADRKTYKLTP